jgi:hypothetical protein
LILIRGHMKTNKHQSLLLVREKGSVRAHHFVTSFNYSPGTARSYLAHLGRQDLLERTNAGHSLTEKGQTRLHFFEVMGCGNPDCPRCERKSGYLTCPTCGCRISKEKVWLRPTWETAFFKREAGVYCPFCQGQVLTEQQAKMIQIKEDMR